MGRYHAKVQSATAIAVDTASFYLMNPAGSGYNLKRVSHGACSLVNAFSGGARWTFRLSRQHDRRAELEMRGNDQIAVVRPGKLLRSPVWPW
jgi:putative flippase GtrA